MLETINKFAPIIEALSVLGSFIFVIWVTCFRKTRQDRIDELMEEMWILLSDKEISVIAYENVDMLLEWLSPKFQKAKYRKLHRHAFKELVREGRIRVSRG